MFNSLVWFKNFIRVIVKETYYWQIVFLRKAQMSERLSLLLRKSAIVELRSPTDA
jgi:hypothetical protein